MSSVLRATRTCLSARSFSTSARSLSATPAMDKLLKKSPDDVVITLAVRSAMCKAPKGGLRATKSDELLLGMFKVSSIVVVCYNQF